MRIGMGSNTSSSTEALRFMAQLGIQDVVLNTPPIPVKDGRWELVDIVALKNRVNRDLWSSSEIPIPQSIVVK